MFFEKGVLKGSKTSQESTWSLFLKGLQAEDLQLYFKKSPAQVFSYEVCKIFKNNFFYGTPPVTAFALPMAASVFFF